MFTFLKQGLAFLNYKHLATLMCVSLGFCMGVKMWVCERVQRMYDHQPEL